MRPMLIGGEVGVGWWMVGGREGGDGRMENNSNNHNNDNQ